MSDQAQREGRLLESDGRSDPSDLAPTPSEAVTAPPSGKSTEPGSDENRQDRWWSRKPKAQRRPILGPRLVWNVFELQHPWKVFFAALAGLVTVMMVVSAILVATSSDSPDDDIVLLDDDVAAGVETSSVQASGSVLPPFAEPDPAMGMSAPTVIASTLDGDRVELGAGGGPVVIGFFAHWAPHSQEEMPQVVQWLDAPDLPTGVEVVAVSTSVRSESENYPPSAWFERVRWPNTVVLDSAEGAIASQFGLTGFPYWVAVNGDGEIVGRSAGQITEPMFRALLAAAAE